MRVCVCCSRDCAPRLGDHLSGLHIPFVCCELEQPQRHGALFKQFPGRKPTLLLRWNEHRLSLCYVYRLVFAVSVCHRVAYQCETGHLLYGDGINAVDIFERMTTFWCLYKHCTGFGWTTSWRAGGIMRTGGLAVLLVAIFLHSLVHLSDGKVFQLVMGSSSAVAGMQQD